MAGGRWICRPLSHLIGGMLMQEEAEGRVCTGQIIIGAAHGQRTDTEKDKEEEEDNEEEEEEEEENRGIITQFFLISKILQH
jgi:hypothetical protein